MANVTTNTPEAMRFLDTSRYLQAALAWAALPLTIASGYIGYRKGLTDGRKGKKTAKKANQAIKEPKKKTAKTEQEIKDYYEDSPEKAKLTMAMAKFAKEVGVTAKFSPDQKEEMEHLMKVIDGKEEPSDGAEAEAGPSSPKKASSFKGSIKNSLHGSRQGSTHDSQHSSDHDSSSNSESEDGNQKGSMIRSMLSKVGLGGSSVGHSSKDLEGQAEGGGMNLKRLSKKKEGKRKAVDTKYNAASHHSDPSTDSHDGPVDGS